jgi:hypothetical protein
MPEKNITEAAVLDILREPFPASQTKTERIGGRTETWVESHWLMERLNAVFGLSWTMEVTEIGTQDQPFARSDGKQVDGQRAWATVRVAFPDPRQAGQRISHDGVGECHMTGHDAARKGAVSLAFRSACKWFTTYLWRSEPQPQAQASAPASSRQELKDDAAEVLEAGQTVGHTTGHKLKIGKHAGSDIGDPKVPAGYLKWMRDTKEVALKSGKTQYEQLDRQLIGLIDEELAWREDQKA